MKQNIYRAKKDTDIQRCSQNPETKLTVWTRYKYILKFKLHVVLRVCYQPEDRLMLTSDSIEYHSTLTPSHPPLLVIFA